MLSSRSVRSNGAIHWIRWNALACPPILVALGCTTPPPPATAVAPTSACAIVAAAPTPPETISVALTEPIDPTRVPTPRNSAERFAFAQAYETLVNVDCEGHAYPGLAQSWTIDATRTRVTLLIRDGARFWNGKPVVTSDVLAAWRATAGLSTESKLARRLADATTIVDDRTLTVSLPDTAWLVLADPALAVYQPQAPPGWAQGSGRYHIVDATVDAEPLKLAPAPTTSDPHLTIRPRRSADPRDAIDAGAALLVTDDPVAVSYAATRSHLTAIPLPWTHTYALAVPGAAPSGATALAPLARDLDTLTASLARDAVHVEARAAQAPYWWSGIQGCEPLSRSSAAAPSASGRRASRIVYRRDDRVARGLAERLVALGRGATATGLAPGDFARALHAGDELAYVLELDRVSLSPCQDLAVLESAAPWLVAGRGEGVATTTLLPLIDTRARAIVSRDRVSAMIDWDGTLRIGGPSRRP